MKFEFRRPRLISTRSAPLLHQPFPFLDYKLGGSALAARGTIEVCRYTSIKKHKYKEMPVTIAGIGKERVAVSRRVALIKKIASYAAGSCSSVRNGREPERSRRCVDLHPRHSVCANSSGALNEFLLCPSVDD